MSYTLIDYFKAFHSLKERQNLSAGSQSVYFSILGEFNAAHYPERLSLSYRELKALAGLKSVSTTHECVNVLKNKKLIAFEAQADGQTWYRLLTEHLPNTYRTLTEHQPNGLVRSQIRAREDVKTSDVKEEGARAHAEIWEVFTDEMQRPATSSERYELVALVEKRGYEKVADALKRTRRIRRYPTYQDFLDVLNGVKKGGGKSGTSGEMHYSEPEDCGVDLTAY